MAQGRSNSLSSGILLTELDMSKIILLLTDELTDVENEMITAWRAGKTKISSALSHSYSISIRDLVARLRGIASALFNETEISKVKPYHASDKTPENFDKYLRVSNNISKLVTQDILYQPDVDHAVAAFDRWLYICKIAFHQHDFFTSSCILLGLSAESITLSKIEDELSHTSAILFQYYQNLLKFSAPLYNKQNALLKYNLEIIPTLRALTNLYDQLDSLPPKGDKHTDAKVADISRQRRAVSKNFSLMQKKKRPELSEENNLILSALYKKFDEKFATVNDDNEEQKKESHFDIRSKTFKSLVITIKHDRISASGSVKSLSTSKPFSVATFSKLADERVELITMQASIGSLESSYDNPISQILYNVKSILGNVELTDRVMRHRINDEFELAEIKLDKKLSKVHKKIDLILRELIINEEVHGNKFKKDKPKETVSSEETKKQFFIEKPSPKLKEISDSRAATEEKSSPNIQHKLEKRISSLSEAESESSKSKKPVVQQPESRQAELLEVEEKKAEPHQVEPHQVEAQKIEAQKIEAQKIEAQKVEPQIIEPVKIDLPKTDLPPPAVESKVPDLSSSLRILNELKQQDTPRETDSAPSSVRSEIEGLLTARSVSHGKKVFEELVAKSGGSASPQQNALVSPRLARLRSSSSAIFFIKKVQGGSSGSLSARVEGSSKEPVIDSGVGGMEIPKQ